MFLLKTFITKINTKNKKLVFLCVTLILPRILVLFALFYDIYIEKQLYWSMQISLILLIPLLTKMSIVFVEQATILKYEYICFLLMLDNLNEIPRELNIYSLNKKEILIKLKIIPEVNDKFNSKQYDQLIFDYVLFGIGTQWFKEIKQILNNIVNWLFLLFVTLNICGQINIMLLTAYG